MVNNGNSTKLFAGVGLAVPRLGNLRLRLHFLRRGTSGVGGEGSQGGIAKNPTINNATNITNVTSGTGRGQRYHTFYSLLKE